MEKLFFVLDVDYVLDKKNYPIIRIFCKDENSKDYLVLYKNFLPYFYVLPKDLSLKEKIKQLKFENVEIVDVCEVEKRFMRKNLKFLKVTISNPRKVPNVRKYIKDNFEVIETFEYDIPFYKRFLIDNNIKPASWIKVEGEEIKENIIKANKIEQVEIEKYPNLKIYAFDIEIVEEKQEEKIAFISIVGNDGFEKVLGIYDINYQNYENLKTEKELIKKFFEIIKERNPDILIGYNTDLFDIPKIKEKCQKYSIELKIGKFDLKIKTTRRKKETAFKIPGRIYLDFYRYVENILAASLRTEVLTLDAVAKEILGIGKKSLTYEEMQELIKGKINLEKIVEYNLWDSKLLLMLSEIFLPQILELSKLTYLLPFDVCRSAYSQLVEAYFLKKAFDQNYISPNRPKFEEIQKRAMYGAYKGAIVFEPITGMHENIVVLDFKSLYPTIIVSHNISPDTLNCEHEECKENKVPELSYWFCKKEKGFIPRNLEELIKKRSEIKKLMKTLDKKSEKYKILDNMQYAIKIISNATYGYMAYVGARWYKRECSESTTAFERFYIKKISEIAKRLSLQIIYGDTDSLMIKGNSKEEIINKANQFLYLVNSILPGIMELEFRGYYVRGIFVKKREGEAGAKKRYALIDEQGNIEIRGFETVRRDWCRLAKEVQRNVIEIILKENNYKKALEYVRNVLNNLKSGNFKLEDLVIHEQLTKPITQYKQISPHVIAAKKAIEKGLKIGIGSVIPFVITKHGTSISDKAQHVLFAKKEDIDVNYYIEHQILPAAIRVLRVFNIKESDILSASKQISLSKWFS